MEYLKLFENHAEYENFVSEGTMLKPNVSHCVSENDMHYNPILHDYRKDYLTIEVIEDGKFKITSTNSEDEGKYISYSFDNGNTWETISITSVYFEETLNVNKGDVILFKGNLSTTPGMDGCYQSNIGLNIGGYYNGENAACFNVYGNIMSQFYDDNFEGVDALPNGGTLAGFSGSKGLISAENLWLPRTLTNGCYYGMFNGCTSLITTPVLPATTLAGGCYSNMFANCTSLTTAPELPATTLASSCYNSMFYNCTSLTTAPELPATTLADWCYTHMFDGCTSLTTAPELPATALANQCYSYMFYGCTSLTTAPVLPATTLTYFCYGSMFYGCTSLNSITCFATDISASACTSDWVYNVASSGTFTKAASMSSWAIGVNGIPNGWTVQDAS